MSKTYNEISYKTSTWLAIINPARVKSLNVKFKEEKYQDNILSELYAQQMLDYLRRLRLKNFWVQRPLFGRVRMQSSSLDLQAVSTTVSSC